MWWCGGVMAGMAILNIFICLKKNSVNTLGYDPRQS
jgi:hypothetical protein